MAQHRDRWGTGGRSVAAIAAACAALVLAAGCAPLYAKRDRDTGIAYLLGEMRAPVDAAPGRVAFATRLAFRALQVRERFTDISGLDAEFTGRTARGKHVRVVVRGTAAGTSAVRIRVGRLGDVAMSQAILDAIRASVR